MWETISGIVFHPVAEVVVLGGLGVMFKQFKTYRKLVEEAIDIPQRVAKAKGPNSPGGEEITTEEWAAVGKEVVELLQIGAPFFKRKPK